MAESKKQETVQPEAIEEDEFFGDNDPDQIDPESAEIIGDRVKRAADVVKKGLSTGAEGVSSVVKRALHSRDHVLMVRINDESLERITDLKDAGLFRSRSEAAAYLIAEGIATKSDLFDRIQTKIKQIQEIKDELRALAEGQEGVDLDTSSESDE